MNGLATKFVVVVYTIIRKHVLADTVEMLFCDNKNYQRRHFDNVTNVNTLNYCCTTLCILLDAFLGPIV